MKRSSNIELFRIVCMLLIIISHFTIHCGIKEYSTINKLVDFFGYWGGAAGNLGFICISAWYLDKFHFSLRKILNIIIKTTIYSMITYGITSIFFACSFTVEMTLESLLPILYGGYHYITVFVMVYFISPMMKRCLELFDRKLLKKLIVITGIILTIIPMVFVGSSNYMNLFTTFIFVYGVIYYIKTYHLLDKVTVKKLLSIFILNVFIMVTYSVIVLILKDKIAFFQPYSSLWASSSGIFMIAAMGSLFFVCLKTDIPYIKGVNAIGTTTLGVYLLHEAPAIRDVIWMKVFQSDTWGMDTFLVLKVIGASCVMFLACAMLELTILKITNGLLRDFLLSVKK